MNTVTSKKDILTPALLLDLNAFESNLARMIEQVKKTGKNLRPHAKAHKCPEIAKRQIAAGAIGVCVATLAEAELMTRAGIPGVLLTSPVTDANKIERIVKTGVMVAVDHLMQVDLYQQAAKAANRTVDVLVDLDVGDHRTGAASLAQAVEIAEAVDRASNLRLRGLQGYSGAASHTMPVPERQQVTRKAFVALAEVRDALAKKGLNTEILTGGSTGTWQMDTAMPEPTELQAGSFVLMDVDYAKAGSDFQHALKVVGTVISANHKAFVTVDSGIKSFATDRAFGPEAPSLPGSNYRFGGDEFGYLDLAGQQSVKLGDRIEFIPPHCDPTMNLYDTVYACRGEKVEGVWPVKRLV